ncbi:hypothetical protein SAMN02745728_01576 [Desulfovibrio litoralis DSM 11393]|uniref:Uncharacterized protein n=1 Tax=Desulfovibrio litoralis DSM 11393 TaxID=1121455 RepID=A0A1M7T638_9BACT|nr:hypothetical protein SAMN02745728_01576 [Desulfovibrio litoralis DSM 11393]
MGSTTMDLNSRKLTFALFFVLIALKALEYYGLLRNSTSYYYFDVVIIISDLVQKIILTRIPVYMFFTLLISGTLWLMLRKQLTFIYLTNITLLVMILLAVYEKLGSFLVKILLYIIYELKI